MYYNEVIKIIQVLIRGGELLKNKLVENKIRGDAFILWEHFFLYFKWKMKKIVLL